MSKKICKIGFFLAGLFFVANVSFGQINEEPGSLTESMRSWVDAMKSFLEKSDKSCFAALLYGYDSNAYLDHQHREGDYFQQIFLEPMLTFSLNDYLKGKVGLEIMSLLYLAEQDVSMFRNVFRAGIQ